MDPRDAPPLVERGGGEPRAGLLHLAEREAVALDPVGVEVLEAEVDGGERRRGAGDGDRALRPQARVSPELGLEGRADVACERLELLGPRRVGVDVTLA